MKNLNVDRTIGGQLTKRGQGAINAAILVAILFGLILLYILAIPPSDRDKILNENTRTTVSSSSSRTNVTLLKEKVGTLEDRNLDQVEHDIPSFTLFRTSGADVLKKSPAFQVRNGIFDFQSREVRFVVDDLELTNNVLLSFSILKAQGTLHISLNGNPIFDGDLGAGQQTPIALSKSDVLKENVLVFSVSGVGWQFWTTNQYQIDTLMITGEVTDTSKESSNTVFFATEKEIDNIDKSTLRFNPDCNPANVGTLDIKLNKRSLFNGVPDCGSLNKVEFNPGLIDVGENTLDFTTSKGSYLMDQIQVKTTLKDQIFPVFYFEVNESKFSDIKNLTLESFVQLEFVDDNEDKILDLNINGHLTNVNQRKPQYSRKITSWIEDGNNYIEIRPKTRVNIVELRVVLSKED